MSTFSQDTVFLKIADFIFKINFHEPIKPELKDALKGRLYGWFRECFIPLEKDNKPDINIQIKDLDQIGQLRDSNKRTTKVYICLYEKKNFTITTYYYINFLQFRLILREALQELITENQGFQIHGSAVIVNNKVVIFIGKHGAGKSTASRLLTDYFPKFADDSLIIRKIGGEYFAFQTFEYEKDFAPKKSNKYQIKSVYFIYKNKLTYKERVSDKKEVINLLLKECWLKNKESLSKQFSTIHEFIYSHDIFFNLYFGLNKEELFKVIKQPSHEHS